MADFKTARRHVEQKVYELAKDIDPTGYNEHFYQEYFSKLSDTEFKKFMQKMRDDEFYNLFFEINNLDVKTLPTMEDIKRIAKKYDIPLTEYVQFRYKRPNNPDKAPISHTPIPVIYALVRPLQQLLDKKNSLASDTSSTNVLTGQVTGKSKSAKISDVETMSMVASNLQKPLKELLGPRSDDREAKYAMLDKIINEGDYDIDDISLKTENKQALETARVMLISAGYRVSYRDKKPNYNLK